MKKIFILIILAVLILFAQMTVPANAAGLPDKLDVPGNLVLTDNSEAEEFKLKLTYNKGVDLSKYLSLKIADRLAQYGYSSASAVLQVDWTVDSTAAGWKYHENWDEIKDSVKNSEWEYFNYPTWKRINSSCPFKIKRK